MRRSAVLEWIVCLVFGCLVPAPAAEPIPPEVSRIISVIGPSSVAHACPISPNLALTAGHVVRRENLAGKADLRFYRAENGEWAGYVNPKFASSYEDAGFLEAETPFPSWYEFALRPAFPGERLWWIGYDWSKKSRAFQRRVFSGRVINVIAGSIILDVPTPPGSSGSCVLDASGKVIGTIAWGHSQEDDSQVAVAVGMWAPWFTGKTPTPVKE